jgi:glycosyltransferase involved in cell wall biosynthesis
MIDHIYLVSLYYSCSRVTGANKRFEESCKELSFLPNVHLTAIVLSGEGGVIAEYCDIVEIKSCKYNLLARVFYYFRLGVFFSTSFKGIVISDFLPIPKVLIDRHNYFQMVHDVRSPTIFKEWELSLVRFFLESYEWRKCPSIIAVSDNTKDDLISKVKINKDKIIVSYNGMSDLYYDYNVSELIRDIDILYVATFEQRKNHEFLVQSINKIVKTFEYHPKVFLLGRDLGCKLKIIDLIDNLKLSNCITIIDSVESEEEIINLYDRTKVFVSPALFEGFGMPLFEALARGCSVCCSDIKVFRGLLNNNAVFFNPYDSTDAADKIFNAIKISKESIPFNFLEMYRWKIIFKKLLKDIKSKNSAH